MAKKSKKKKLTSKNSKKPNKSPAKVKIKPEKIPPLEPRRKDDFSYTTDILPRQDDLNRPIVEGVEIDREAYLEEKVHTGVQMPYFLPFLDYLQTLNTTEEMILAYRRMLSNPEVNAAFYNNILAVMSLNLKIHPVDKKNKRDVEVAKFIEWNLKRRVRGGVPGITHCVLAHACMDGYSVNEKVWEIQQDGKYKGYRVLKDLKPKDVIQDIVPYVDSFRNLIGIKALRYNSGIVYHPNDFIIYTRLPLFGNPLGISLFRAAYQAYWFLDAATKIRFQAMEKRALPVLVGEADATQQVQLQNVLAKIKSQNWLSVPRDTKIQVLDIAGSSNEVFQAFCRDQQTRIFMAINGAELHSMTSGANNPRGDSSIHENTMELRTYQLAESFCNCISDEDTGLIKDMITGQDNFSGVTEYPFATLSGIDDKDLLASLQIDQGLKEIGFRLSSDELSERYNRFVPTDPEDEIQTPEETMAMMDYHTGEISKAADRKHEKSMMGSGGRGGSDGSNGSAKGGGGKRVKAPSSEVGGDVNHHKEALEMRKYRGIRGGKWLITSSGKKIHDDSARS